MEIEFSQHQDEYFYQLNTKYRIMPKGRRTGFTHASALRIMMECLAGDQDLQELWVDTVYTNIERYVDRYFLPVLKQYSPSIWSWKAQKKEMTILGSVIDFRSADRPENIEGFGYHRITINEAGIILKGERGRYLWQNTILPMTMDFPGVIVFVGGTPKGRRGKDGKPTMYYELYKRAKGGNKKYGLVEVATDENPFIDEDAVQEVRDELPEGPVRDQEFYGKFVASVSGIIKDEWFHIDEVPLEGDKVRSWDLAFTVKEANDYSAGTLVSRNETNYQIQHSKKVKLHWPDLKLLIMSTAELDGVEVPVIIEEAGQQIGYCEDLQSERRMQNYNIIGQRPEGDKLVRAMKWASRLKSGQVTLLHGEWNQDFISECSAFTNDDTHAHDDQIDGVSGAWQYFNSERVGVCYV